MTFGWFSKDKSVGVNALEEVFDTIPSSLKLGSIVRGTNTLLGDGDFILLKGAASLSAGHFVSFNSYTGAVSRNPAANSGDPLAVAMAAATEDQYCFYQLSGTAVGSVGSASDGASLYFNVAGAAQASAVDGKQILGAVCASGVSQTIDASVPQLSPTQSLVTLSYPHMQGQIT